MTNTVRASDIATPVRVPKAAELVAAQLRGQIVRGELIVPFEIPGPGVEREDAVSIKVVSGTVAVVAVWPRIAGGPVERVG